MKKRFSALTVGIVAFLMLATGVAASSYYHWAGSENFDSSMNTMDKVQYGITLLMGDLETEKTDHESTQTKLNKANSDLKELENKIAEATPGGSTDIQDLINDRDRLSNELKTMTDDRDDLQGEINSIATKVSQSVASINSVNGAGPRYNKLVEALPNSTLDYLYGLSTNEAMYEPYLNPELGNGPTDRALIQAIEDMEDVKEKSDNTLGKFDADMIERIEEAHKNKDYTPDEEGKDELNEQ